MPVWRLFVDTRIYDCLYSFLLNVLSFVVKSREENKSCLPIQCICNLTVIFVLEISVSAEVESNKIHLLKLLFVCILYFLSSKWIKQVVLFLLDYVLSEVLYFTTL